MRHEDSDAKRHQMHWDGVNDREPTQLSWYQPHPTMSMELITALGVGVDAAVIDVGGGASTLVDGLVAGGFTDVSVLDVSPGALDTARRRLAASAQKVQWLHQDLLSWKPTRGYDLWHDRAVFHFLVDQDDQRQYGRVLRRAIAPGGAIVIATFAADGPTHCSGLPVARYGSENLLAALRDDVELVATQREEHTTPAGTVQPFTWLAFRSEPSHYAR